MKIPVLIAIIVVIIAGTSIITASLITNSNQDQEPILVPKENLQNETVNLTMEEVAKHSSQSDCWLVISNKVYNVTSFINQHPGGAGAVIANCGKDATAIFNSKHAQGALANLTSFSIGDLNSQASIINSTRPSKSVPPQKEYDDDEYDD